MTWTSFDKHFSQSPKAFLQPQNKAEVVDVVRRAGAEVCVYVYSM